MQAVSKFTYTLETLIQAGKLLVAVDHVPIRTNPKTRESRLFPSTPAYVRRNALSIFRVYSQYQPLRVFWSGALIMGVAALAVVHSLPGLSSSSIRDAGTGHIQSLIAGGVLFNAAMLLGALGVIGDLLDAQRTLSQRTFERVRRIELQLGVKPSHYEPGRRRAAAPRRSRRDAGAATTPRPARPDGHRGTGPQGARGMSCARSRPPAATRSTSRPATRSTSTARRNPVVRRLMAGFERTLDELFAIARARHRSSTSAAARGS